MPPGANAGGKGLLGTAPTLGAAIWPLPRQSQGGRGPGEDAGWVLPDAGPPPFLLSRCHPLPARLADAPGQGLLKAIGSPLTRAHTAQVGGDARDLTGVAIRRADDVAIRVELGPLPLAALGGPRAPTRGRDRGGTARSSGRPTPSGPGRRPACINQSRRPRTNTVSVKRQQRLREVLCWPAHWRCVRTRTFSNSPKEGFPAASLGLPSWEGQIPSCLCTKIKHRMRRDSKCSSF